MGILNSYNFVTVTTVEYMYKLFAPNQGFSRSANLTV